MMKHLEIQAGAEKPPTRDLPAEKGFSNANLQPAEVKVHPAGAGGDENASIFFVGTATTILEWEGIRLMTDPNFLHAGDHVHLGPGVTSARRTNPAIDLHDLPNIDVVLLSHYHEDHFDRKVEKSLRRDLPIITTPHAKSHLQGKGEGENFTDVYDLDFYDGMMVDVKKQTGHSKKRPAIKVTGMPGKHVPSGLIGTLNDMLNAVPPTNGWMVELGYSSNESRSDQGFRCGYRIYISGDTLMVDELREIPQRYRGQNIDLMLIHLGGTTIPSSSVPLLMVTMDAEQGLELIRLINPDLTIPIHFDDYDIMKSPLSDFKKVIDEAGLGNKVVYLDRKDQYKFLVKD